MKIDILNRFKAKQENPFEKVCCVEAFFRNNSPETSREEILNWLGSDPLTHDYLFEKLKFGEKDEQLKALGFLLKSVTLANGILLDAGLFKKCSNIIGCLHKETVFSMLRYFADLRSEYSEQGSYADLLELLLLIHESYADALIRLTVKKILLSLDNKNPSEIRCFFHSGNYLYEEGVFDKAITFYSAYLLFNRSESQAYLNRGLCKYNLRLFDEAISDYRAAIELDENNPVILNYLADCFYKKTHFDEAVELYSGAISLNPHYLKAFYNRGLAWACLQDYEMAIHDFSEVLSLNPDFADAYTVRARAYLYMNNFEKAEKDVKKAIEIQPEYKEAISLLDEIRAKKNHPTGEGFAFDPDERRMESRHGFSDVAGYESLKKQLYNAIILPLSRPDLADRFLLKRSAGILLYGPPGCGKTYIALALQRELGIPLYFVDGTIQNMYVGNSEAAIKSVFAAARKNSPALIFIDECDSLIVGRDNNNSTQNYERKLANQFLEEMTLLENDKSAAVYVLCATNLPFLLDKAFLRAGRIQQKIFIPGPDESSREQILQYSLKGLDGTGSIDYKKIAAATANCSSSLLTETCNMIRHDLMVLALENKNTSITTRMLLDKFAGIPPDLAYWLPLYEKYRRNEQQVYKPVGFQ